MAVLIRGKTSKMCPLRSLNAKHDAFIVICSNLIRQMCVN